ncbi:Bacterial regulatory protein, MarR, partial [mine drainage metagenome]
MNNPKGSDTEKPLTEGLIHSIQALIQEIMFLQIGTLRESGMTIPKLFMLKFLNRHGRRKTSVIAQLLGISLPTVSEILTSMEFEGLIERIHIEEDRRVIMIDISSKGRDILELAENRNQTMLQE